jgi:hypothetical protein
MSAEVVSFLAERVSSYLPRTPEASEVHSRLQKLALGIEESRQYWEAPPGPSDRALAAFEGRWFGSKSLPRVRFLLANLAERYDAFPEALAVLRRFRAMDVPTRRVICHAHLQLSDPLYRRFTGGFLVEQRSSGREVVDRHLVLRWLREEFPREWSESTRGQFASKLLSAASEAGLVSPKRDPRTLLLPRVTDAALAYVLHLLRLVRFEGTLTENPYLSSVGLVGGTLDRRLRALPPLDFHRMGELVEVDFRYPSLTAWADATL